MYNVNNNVVQVRYNCIALLTGHKRLVQKEEERLNKTIDRVNAERTTVTKNPRFYFYLSFSFFLTLYEVLIIL